MFDPALLDSLALVVAVGALAHTGWRLADALAPDAAGLPRAISAVTLAASLAVFEALGLGRFGLGGDPVALTLFALAGAIAAQIWTPRRPGTSPVAELAASLKNADPRALAGWGAVAGAVLAIAAIQLHRPVLGTDAIAYHLPEVIGWVQSGHTGRVLEEFYGLPVGNYPITQEVLLAWATGITHGFSAALVLTLATPVLLLGAGWLTLAELNLAPAIRALSLGALALVPLVLQAWTEPGTDLAALTWLVCCAALCLAARRNPGLLSAAMLAGALAVGTKTTVLSYTLVILAFTAWFRRRELRAHVRALGASAVLAVVTGPIWYLRNWLEHGSPLWPFSSFPGGDPRPPIINYLSTSLLDDPRATLLDHLNAYVPALSGGVVLIVIATALIIPGALRRRRRLLGAAVVVAVGSLVYADGPVTGLPPGGLLFLAAVGSTLRYLMPVFTAGTVALALAAADSDRRLAVAGGLALAATVVWDVVSDASHAFFLGFDGWLWPGMALGALILPVLGWGLGRTARRRMNTPGAVIITITVMLLAALVLAGGATHFSLRHGVTPDYAQDVDDFLLTQPAYVDSSEPVATTRAGLAPLAGDRLQHPLSLIPEDAPCQQVGRLHEHGWIVIAQPLTPTLARIVPPAVSPAGSAPGCLARSGAKPVWVDGAFAVFSPLQSAVGVA